MAFSGQPPDSREGQIILPSYWKENQDTLIAARAGKSEGNKESGQHEIAEKTMAANSASASLSSRADGITRSRGAKRAGAPRPATANRLTHDMPRCSTDSPKIAHESGCLGLWGFLHPVLAGWLADSGLL